MQSPEYPHRRLNALTGDWILVSPHRTQRPWRGKVEPTPVELRPAYDPECYLCPGNPRAGGLVNPAYEKTFVFTNDFSALLPDVPGAEPSRQSLFQSATARGVCRVICFSPRHDLTLPEMSLEAIEEVIGVWAEQTRELGAKWRWVQVFENKGEIMGCSNPHPHGQIWAGGFLPNEPAKEEIRQREYWQRNRRPLLEDYLKRELSDGRRLVLENSGWAAVVPFWATWPFETLVLPRRRMQQLYELDDSERRSLADVLKRLLTRYDNLFEASFPYSMGWHGAPTGGEDHPHWLLHAHFMPPLLRSASVKKFMVGYEMLAEAQRDFTPEQAAARLQSLSDTHYKDRTAGRPIADSGDLQH
jgi:UDPglucose--hexose-1-phosphate uridylyltransferase